MAKKIYKSPFLMTIDGGDDFDMEFDNSIIEIDGEPAYAGEPDDGLDLDAPVALADDPETDPGEDLPPSQGHGNV